MTVFVSDKLADARIAADQPSGESPQRWSAIGGPW